MGSGLSTEEQVKAYVEHPNNNKVVNLADGSKVSYAEHGPADGIPLFYLPGISGCRFLVNTLLNFPESERFRVFCLDYPGYGHTTLAPSRSLDHYNEIFSHFIDVVLPDKNEKFMLMGHSAGGVHITAVATDEKHGLKERVSGMVLLAPWASTTTKGMKYTTSLASFLPSFVVRSLATVSLFFNQQMFKFASVDSMMTRILSDREAEVFKSWKVTPSAWTAFISHVHTVSTFAGFTETFLLCTETYHKFQGKLNLSNTGKQCKILIIAGDMDNMVSDEAVFNFYVKDLDDQTKTRVSFHTVTHGTHDGIPITHSRQALQYLAQIAPTPVPAKD